MDNKDFSALERQLCVAGGVLQAMNKICPPSRHSLSPFNNVLRNPFDPDLEPESDREIVIRIKISKE